MGKIDLFKVNIPDSVNEVLKPVFESGYIANGQMVREFETLLNNYIGNQNLVTTNSGTSSLTLSLLMAGVTPGDEVIASPMTCLATNMPILSLNARPVWCDINPKTGNIDPKGIEKLVSEKTKAILYVHWAGDVGEIDEINEISEKYKIKVIEDAADAFGAEYQDKKLGNTQTDFVCFSFQATKHITTGEGGAISFANPDDVELANQLKYYGICRPTFRDEYGEINPESDITNAGFKFYMNNIAAAIGIEQMQRIETIISRHRENGNYYVENLKEFSGLEILERKSHTKSSFWVFSMLVDRRDDFLRAMDTRGIRVSRLHMRNDTYSVFKTQTTNVELPGVDEFSKRFACIPCGWWVKDEDREYIVDSIRMGW